VIAEPIRISTALSNPKAHGWLLGDRAAPLTAEKMKDCRWVKPVLVGQFEFVFVKMDAGRALAAFAIRSAEGG
jgi:hypothetical protein